MVIPTVYLDDVTLAYGETILFSKLNLQLSAGKWTSLLGTSGVGKSSLLRMIAGLMAQETICGKIYADNGQALLQQVAYMAQNDLLLPWLSVLANATLKLKLRNHRHIKEREITRAVSLLEKVGLGHALHLYPHQLSGGMRQRVALVRTLMENKPIVLMDEPFSGLDAITRYKLQELAVELLNSKTVLFVTHDPQEALRLAHEIYLMHGHPATLKLLSKLTSITPRKISDTEIAPLQATLFDELAQAAGVT